jgi:signal transduction histidine kinase
MRCHNPSVEGKCKTYLLVSNGLVEDMRGAFNALTGYSKDEFIHKPIAEVMRILFGFHFEPDKKAASENYLFTKSEEAVEVHIKCYKIGKAEKMIYLIEQKSNYILNHELALLDNMVRDNNMGVGLYSYPGFQLLKANTTYQDYIRHSYHVKGRLNGLCMEEIVPSFEDSGLKQYWIGIAERKKTDSQKELQTISATGETRYWNKTVSTISVNERVKYILSFIEDITDTVMKRKHLEDKYEELKRAVEMKDEMLMLVTHELKTPMSVITSSIQAVELIYNNELSDKVRKYLNKIKQNTYRQIKLVNNILDNTRANSGIFRINRANADLVQLTRILIDSISVFAERKGIKIVFTSDMEQSIIKADVDIYERILLNLLSNAVKYTPEGRSVEVYIYQTVLKAKRQVCVQVKDSGIGIPNDQKELIFERFRRVDRISSRNTEGTGIGLYLVKTLVSLLDGEIKVESKEGVGSTFSLYFPLIKINQDEVPAVFKASNEQLATATAIEFSDIYYGV